MNLKKKTIRRLDLNMVVIVEYTENVYEYWYIYIYKWQFLFKKNSCSGVDFHLLR